MALEVLPENFFARLFSYFGLTISSFMLLSGIFLSQTGLSSVVNPAMWVVASFASLVFSYSVRSYISRNFGLVVVLLVLLVIFLIFLHNRFHEALNAYLLTSIDSNIVRITFSFTYIFLPCSLFCIALVSYRKHDLSVPEEVPLKISEAVKAQVLDNPIFYEDFSIEATIEHLESADNRRIRVDLTANMVVRNRTGESLTMPHRYSRSTGSFRLNKLTVNGKPRDIRDPSIHAGDGIRATDIIPPKGVIEISAAMTEYFEHDDAHLYSCFDCPADKFSLLVSNLSPDKLEVVIEKNNLDSATYERDGDTIKWESNGALLPHQGARLVWKMV